MKQTTSDLKSISFNGIVST